MPRATNLQQVFQAMPDYFAGEKARELRAVIQFDLAGEGGGKWSAAIAEQKLAITPGAAANPNLTISAEAADYLAIANGDLEVMPAFMSGKIKIKGDMSLAMRLQALLTRKP